MANITSPLPEGGMSIALDTTAVIPLRTLGDARGKTVYLQVVTGGADPGSFVIKQAIRNSGLTGTDLVDCSYTHIGAGGVITAAGTAVSTGGRVYVVISDGMDTYLDYTAGTDGMTVYANCVTA